MEASLVIRRSFWSLELNNRVRGRELLHCLLVKTWLSLHEGEGSSLVRGMLEQHMLHSTLTPSDLLSRTDALGNVHIPSIDALQLVPDEPIVRLVLVPQALNMAEDVLYFRDVFGYNP